MIIVVENGENGLKMIAAAAIRKGYEIELRSRNWIAVPESQKEIINEGKNNEKTIERLLFRVKRKTKEDCKAVNDGDNIPEIISSTTFVNPPSELINLFRNIKDYVLIFDPRIPVTSTKGIDVLSPSSGRLYIRNIFIPGKHDILYSYHLKEFDIENRDRNTIANYSMKSIIKELLESTTDKYFISTFLSGARLYLEGNEYYLEFNTSFNIPTKTKNADIWIDAFKSKYGNNTTIRSIEDTDVKNYYQAKHLGINVINLPKYIARALLEIEGTKGQKIMSYVHGVNEAIENAIFVPNEDLTPEELKILNHLDKYNKILNLYLSGNEDDKPIKTLKVFDYPEDYCGTRVGGFVDTGDTDTINIYRTSLKRGIIYSGHIFFHEATHAITGAEDAEKDFRNFLSMLLSQVAVTMYPLQDSIEDGGVAKDVAISDVNDLFKEYAYIGTKEIEGDDILYE